MTVRVQGRVQLRAQHEPVDFRTSDGFILHGEISTPVDRPASATLVTVHPLPTAGGNMDSHLLWKASRRLPELADIAVVRFNSRGTSSPSGASEGEFSGGAQERMDIAAAMQTVQERGLPNPWLFGWSYGTDLVLQYGLEHPIVGAVLFAPPLRRTGRADVAKWQQAPGSLVALIPEFDDFLRPAEAAVRFRVAPDTKLVTIAGGNHLCEGEAQVVDVLDQIVAALGTADTPLPIEVNEDRMQQKPHQ